MQTQLKNASQNGLAKDMNEDDDIDPEATKELQSKIEQLMNRKIVNADLFQKQVEDEAQQIHTLISGLDDIFSKISMLTADQPPAPLPKVDIPVVQQPQPKPVVSLPAKIRVEAPKVSTVSVVPPQAKPQQKVMQTPPPQPTLLGPQLTLGIRNFQLGKKVGQGTFGEVQQAKHKYTQGLYAIKKIYKSIIQQRKMQDQVLEDLAIHASLVHPNIVRLYSCWTDQYHIFMLLEYIDGLSLQHYFKSDEEFVSRVTYQTMKALQYMHRNFIAHRDIKPENIIYSHGTVKLCDFGWAYCFKQELSNTYCGTPAYLSPEVIQQIPCGHSVDLWSLGILVFELLTGTLPFWHDSPKLLPKVILNCDKQRILWPPQVGKEAKDFISRLLKKNPQQRMSLAEGFNHPFILRHNARVQQISKDIGDLILRA